MPGRLKGLLDEMNPLLCEVTPRQETSTAC